MRKRRNPLFFSIVNQPVFSSQLSSRPSSTFLDVAPFPLLFFYNLQEAEKIEKQGRWARVRENEYKTGHDWDINDRNKYKIRTIDVKD